VTDRPVLSETVLRSMSGCLMHESAIVGCEPCDYLMTQGRAVESAVVRELAQGVDVEALAVAARADQCLAESKLYEHGPSRHLAVTAPIAAALTRAIAGERAKASAREAMWRELRALERDADTGTLDLGRFDRRSRIAALRAQLLGAPDGR
jgi:hypothetical protein